MSSATLATTPSQAKLAPKGAARVLIASINREVGDTGVHVHTRALREGLTAAGISCDECSPFSAGAHWPAVFAIRRLIHPLNKSWSTRWYRRWHFAALRDNLLKYLSSHSVDHLIAQCPVSAQAALEARAQHNRDFEITMVCHFNHSEAREYFENGELDRATHDRILDFERRVLSEVDRVIYVSKWAQETVEQERGIHPRASCTIWNGIAPHAQASAISRSSLGMHDDDVVLINVGTLERRKNQLGLIDFFAGVARQFPAARLVLVGDGPNRAAIVDRIQRLGLGEKIRVLGRRHDVPSILPAADLYVHYAKAENCPIALLEAARAGLPIAAVPAGGAGEILEKLGGVAILPEVIDQSLAEIVPLLHDADLRRQRGNSARQAFAQHFALDAMINSYCRALRLEPQTAQREAP